MQTLKRPTSSTESFDVQQVRADFPALEQTLYEDRPLVYLDNAASSLKPRQVTRRLTAYYEHEHSNIHRGVHYLSQQATDAYEQARARIAAFINAPSTAEVIFTRGTTEAINLVASSYGRSTIGEGDEIVISAMEHHSNIVPWQMLCDMNGAALRIVPVDERGVLDLETYVRVLNERTRLVAVTHVSNALGTVNPVEHIIAEAHRREIPVLLDGAQAVPHMGVDVQRLDCDFYCFSGHKMFGPTGIGILYGREALLEAMPPYQGGGDMIDRVTFEGTTWNDLPHKFEAGTPHIAGAVGLGTAVDYLESIGMAAAARYEDDLLRYATEQLEAIDDLRIVGTAPHKAGVISLLVGEIHPYDAGTILDRLGIAVRTGHHCTQPLMDRLGLPGTVRASFAFYNTREEVDRLVEGLRKVRALFG